MNTYGLIGKNISYSFSEKYFTEKFQKENILNSQYKTFDLQAITELPQLLENQSIRGLNVTIPYKTQIINYLDELSEEAEKIGAVNCISISEIFSSAALPFTDFSFLTSSKVIGGVLNVSPILIDFL